MTEYPLNGLSREGLLKEKAQYSRPPCANLLRSTAFETEIIIYLFYKTTYLIEEVNCTNPSLSVSIPWFQYQVYSVTYYPFSQSCVSVVNKAAS